MYKTHRITYTVDMFCRTPHIRFYTGGKRQFTMSTCLP